jgi:multiple sugar transport system ATP-binding protein
MSVVSGSAVSGSAVSGPVVSGPVVSGPAVSGPVVSGPVVSGPVVSGPVVSGSAVSMEGLTKVFATGVRAVDGLDLQVAAGEFVVLVGPSGCGKTTALRMVAGLETITSGALRFGDRVVNDVSPRQRDVAMVFQNYALYPHLTVAQNIGFSLENKKVPRAERDRRVGEAAGMLGLGDLLGRRPGQLSGGQRQRVAMGRAIVREPAVFLMDEPLSNLDAKLRVQMRAEVLGVQQRLGAARGTVSLYVTHDQTEAMTMGDRVAVLRTGVLEQYGTPRELYERPASLFVASFIGSPAMNLYEAALEQEAVVVGSQRIPVPGTAGRPGREGLGAGGPRCGGLAAYRGRKVIVGIRPEHLVVGASAGVGVGAGPGAGAGPGSGAGVGADGSEGEAGLAADVRLVEALGSEQLVHFTMDAPQVRVDEAVSEAGVDNEVGGSQTDRVVAGGILATRAANGVAVTPPRVPVRAGDRVRFTVDPAALYFFDPDTHLAIG